MNNWLLWVFIYAVFIVTALVSMLLVFFFDSILSWPWIARLAEKFNKRSYLSTKKRNYSLAGIIFLSLGFLEVIPFYFLYYKAEFYVLACTFRIVGAIFKFMGIIKVYQGTHNIGFQNKIALVYMFSIWVFGGQILYFFVLILTHI